jgi:hypothetical protein
MALFNFTTIALEEGATFVFGSCVCVANGAGDFLRYLVDTRKLEASAPKSRRNIDDLVDDLGEI